MCSTGRLPGPRVPRTRSRWPRSAAFGGLLLVYRDVGHDTGLEFHFDPATESRDRGAEAVVPTAHHGRPAVRLRRPLGLRPRFADQALRRERVRGYGHPVELVRRLWRHAFRPGW